MVIRERDTCISVGKLKTKAVPAKYLNHFREECRSIVKRDYQGKPSKAAIPVGVTQSQLNDFLNGKKGIGLPFLIAVADYEHRPLDDMIGRKVAFGATAIDPRIRRYPNLALAFQMLSPILPPGIDEETLGVAAKSNHDRSVAEWARLILFLVEEQAKSTPVDDSTALDQQIEAERSR